MYTALWISNITGRTRLIKIDRPPKIIIKAERFEIRPEYLEIRALRSRRTRTARNVTLAAPRAVFARFSNVVGAQTARKSAYVPKKRRRGATVTARGPPGTLGRNENYAGGRDGDRTSRPKSNRRNRAAITFAGRPIHAYITSPSAYLRAVFVSLTRRRIVLALFLLLSRRAVNTLLYGTYERQSRANLNGLFFTRADLAKTTANAFNPPGFDIVRKCPSTFSGRSEHDCPVRGRTGKSVASFPRTPRTEHGERPTCGTRRGRRR